MEEAVAKLGSRVTISQLRESILENTRVFCGYSNQSFPGSQPVSLCQWHLDSLVNEAYVACEKTDGIRYLCYVSAGNMFLIDRKEELIQLKLFMPQKNDMSLPLRPTLLDGELVYDKVINSEGEETGCLRYLIFDAVRINDESTVQNLNLLDRLRLAYKLVLKPRLEYEKASPNKIEEEKKRNSYVELYLKDFYEVDDVAEIWKFSKKLPHLCDGIIFTPVNLKYIPGTCKQLLKWKPPHLNSADFEPMVVNSEGSILIRLGVGVRGETCFKHYWLGRRENDKDEFDELVNLIRRKERGKVFVECVFDPKAVTTIPKERSKGWSISDGVTFQGGWVKERIRTDRILPNDESVVTKVLQSLEEGVTIEAICTATNAKARPLSQRCIMPSYYEQYASSAVNKTTSFPSSFSVEMVNK